MTDEFVDFYEILELPLDAERSTIRKRISEMYVEAQRNLDHRNFATRVRFQQLFEVTLPQARYILLDEERRHDYDRLVEASRAAAQSAAPAPANEASTAETKPARGASKRGAGRAPSIDALPRSSPGAASADPQTLEREREELWNKWKSGLQSALERDDAKQTGGAAAPTGRSEAAPNAPVNRATPKVERPKVKFDFNGESPRESPVEPPNAPAPAQGAPAVASSPAEPVAGALPLDDIEQRRTDHRRAVTKRELLNTGAKSAALGAAAVLVPGIILMVGFMLVFYPPNQQSALPIKSAALMWLIWLVVLGGAAYLCAQWLSKAMRRKRAMELAALSYEELLRRTDKES